MPKKLELNLKWLGLALLFYNIFAYPVVAAVPPPYKTPSYQDFSDWYLTTYKLTELPFRAAAVFDAETLSPLYFHQETTVMPTASLMKLIAAGALLSYQPNWYIRNQITELENEKLLRPYVGPRDTFALLKLEPEDTITLEQALAATLIGSANNTAAALGKFISIPRADFIKRMQWIAQNWGLTYTTVEEPSGLSLSNTSTAHDLALAACRVFKDFVVSHYASNPKLTFTTQQGSVKTILHTVHDLRQHPDRYFGAKTGYLTETKFHLAAGYITPQGKRVCFSVLSAPSRAASEAVGRALGLWVDSMYRWP